jgi:hypothetical protein
MPFPLLAIHCKPSRRLDAEPVLRRRIWMATDVVYRSFAGTAGLSLLAVAAIASCSPESASKSVPRLDSNLPRFVHAREITTRHPIHASVRFEPPRR